jgi:SprT protein
MPKQEAPLAALAQYIPQDSVESVLYYLQTHNVHLTITRRRQSILGDYRHAAVGQTHRISINGNLNKYAFLITLLHELAHLFVFEKFGNKVQAHGKEWKNEFSKILANFLEKRIFPKDIENALQENLHSPAASSCADEILVRVLHNYDKNPDGIVLLEQLPENSFFKITGGRVFKKGNKIRKRYKCIEIETGKFYLFSPVYVVASMYGNPVV